MCVHFTHRVLYYHVFQRKLVAEKRSYDENRAERRSPFKPKSASSIEGNEVEDFLKAVPGKKDEKIITSEVKPKRVKDLLKSFSKFDEDIQRLRGIENIESIQSDDSVNKLSIEEMQAELQEYVLERDRIKTNLNNLVQRVNQTSEKLEQEEQKIKSLTQEIQLRAKKQFSNMGDE